MTGPPEIKKPELDKSLNLLQAKAMVVEPGFNRRSLLDQVYCMLLCTHIWTRRGNLWYDPQYPEYSEHVDKVLQAMEEVLP
jgi:hypothetical protein